MLEQLMDLVKQNAGDAVINNPDVPNETNHAVVAEAGHSIIGGLKDMIAQGNVQDVAGLFQHQGAGSNNDGELMDTIKGVFSR